MNQHDALRVLIENSLVLSDPAKHKLLGMIPAMTADQVQGWGQILSTEQDLIDEMEKSQQQE